MICVERHVRDVSATRRPARLQMTELREMAMVENLLPHPPTQGLDFIAAHGMGIVAWVRWQRKPRYASDATDTQNNVGEAHVALRLLRGNDDDEDRDAAREELYRPAKPPRPAQPPHGVPSVAASKRRSFRLACGLRQDDARL
ncbi:hypothetical protein Efla_006976 [Eimeria flavescens]